MKGSTFMFCLLFASVCGQSCPNKKGERGDRGPSGSPGLPGIKGQPGNDGLNGSPGLIGYPGPKGVPGEDGRWGPKGDQGQAIPIPMHPGDPGLHGEKGNTGLPGFPGVQGVPGESGDSGVQGLPGFPGPQGSCSSADPCPHVGFAGRARSVKQSKEETLVDLEVMTDSCQAGCYTSQSGFTAPFSGIYTFGITATANGDGVAPLLLYKNDDVIATTARSSSLAVGVLPHSTVQVNVHLETGDVVALKVKGKGSGIGSTVTGWFRDPTDVTFIGHSVPYP